MGNLEVQLKTRNARLLGDLSCLPAMPGSLRCGGGFLGRIGIDTPLFSRDKCIVLLCNFSYT